MGQVLGDRISGHWRDKFRDSEIQTHIASAAFDFHPKESMVWLELYMQRFMGYKRYKAAPVHSRESVYLFSLMSLVTGSIDHQSQLLSHDSAPPGIEGKATYVSWIDQR